MSSPRSPIAIVGVSALFPGSSDACGFWRDILAGRDLIRDVPESHWLIDDYYDPDPSAPDKTYARRGAFLDPIDFDALSWGIPPATVPATDTSQLLALIVARAVLEDAAREQFEQIDRSRMSIILGVTSGQDLMSTMVARLQRPIWVKALRESGLPEDEVQAACERIASHYVPWQEASFPGLLGNVVAGRVANRLNLGGTNCVTDAACASSLSAVAMAVSELQLGDSDLVIAGGVDTLNDIFMYMCFSKTPALSPSGDCRPFSNQADGTMLGEGLGMVAMKRLEDAERDGDRIYAVLRGLGTSSDGRSKSVYAPVPEGQAQALRRAYAQAGYGPDSVELMEAHGTGTRAGDAAEFEGLRQVFGAADAQRRQWCALGSVKSQIGHTKAAAGAAGLFKTIMALHHKVLPPTIKVEAPNPKLAISDSPFYLNTESRPWIRDSRHPRRASVSAFGFGGSNFHITLEEYRGNGLHAEPLPVHGHELLVLSADSSDSLLQQARALGSNEQDLTSLARHTREQADNSQPYRLALVASDRDALRKALHNAVSRMEQNPESAFVLPDGSAYGVGQAEGELAFVFPGQGSQYTGMGAALAMHFAAAREVWDQSADLPFDPEVSLAQRVFPLPAFDAEQRQRDTEALTDTRWAQPALGAMSLATLAVLEQLELRPQRVAGHSFGELLAMHAAGVFDADTLLRVARRRGELMAGASASNGAMSAVAASMDQLRPLLEGNDSLVVANHNGPKQVVVAGPEPDLARLETQLEAAGIAARRLPVANAFHSPLVAHACTPFAEFLAGQRFAKAGLPVYSNTQARQHQAEPDALRSALAEQLARPVRYLEMIEQMYADGVRCFVEVGPGQVLSGLIAGILGQRPHQVVSLDRKGRDGVESLLRGLAQLYAAGRPMKLASLFAGCRLPAVPSKPKMALPLTGSNYGRMYPPAGGTAALPAPNPPRPEPSSPPQPPAVAAATPANKLAALPPASPASAAEAPAPQSTPAMPDTRPTGPAATRGAINAPVDQAWLQVFADTQQQTAEAHAAFQRSMADSHSSYLQMAESALQSLARLAANGTEVSAPHTAGQHTLANYTASVTPPPPAARPQPPAAVAPPPAAVTPPPATLAPPGDKAPLANAALAPKVTSQRSATPAAQDLSALILGIVADKTGYPLDMLSMDMDLEGDLGIDSIKRVEILAALDEQAPELPRVERSQLSTLHTLGEIVAALGSAVPAAPAVAPASPGPAPAAQDLSALILGIVADKTGYPLDMLSMDMDLEGDLGIDSIKRVEILAALDEQAPELPRVERSQLSTLHTLGEIVAALGSAAPVAPAVAPASPSPAPAAQDLSALILGIVADKTGYPLDMLSMDMDLEGDLGIDSIKRVEILAALDEQAPELPRVERSQLSTLHTLGEIVAALGSAAPAAPAAAPASPTPAPATLDLSALILGIVADKTGYPLDMLSMDMDLEGDLGIDSIKRVEILAALDEQAPELPRVERSQLSTLHTLGEIVAALQPTTAAPASAAAPARPVSNGNGHAVHQQLPGRYQVQLLDAAPAGLAMAGLYAQPLWVLGGSDVDQALADALQAQGIDARVASALPDDASACIYLGGLRELDSVDAALSIQREAFALARQLAGKLHSERGLLVSVQDTGADFGLSGAGLRAWLCGLPALIKTAALEWPQATVKAIDIERAQRPAEQIASELVRELLAGGAEIEVALAADGSRRTLVCSAQPAAPGEPLLQADDVIVVSGGGRGVTAACMRALAADTRARFVLLGRSALNEEPEVCHGLNSDGGLKQVLLKAARAEGRRPSPAELQREVDAVLGAREVRATLAAIEAAGGKARYCSLDVCDAAALKAALDKVRAEWGPIRGVIHAAGVLADKRLAEKSDAQFQRVFDTKLLGLQALLEATRDEPLKLLCVFSSVAARCGNPGQADYAMANETLARVCSDQAQRRPGLVARSMGWGPWEAGMVTPALRAHFEARGVPLISLDQGAALLVAELRGTQPGAVELVLGAEPRAEALLGQGQALRCERVELHIDRHSHGYLAGHSIDGVPVVPVVLVAEWLSRAARGLRPGLKLASLHELKVLKGVRLTRFDSDTERLCIEASALPSLHGALLQMKVLGSDGTPHYSARAEMLPLDASGDTQHPAPPALDLQQWNGESLYQHLLFHRDSFELIEHVDGISDQGVGARVHGLDKAGWDSGPWQMDVAALDGGMQMAVLLGHRVLGGANLPTAIDELRWFAQSPISGPVHAAAYRRKHGTSMVTTDILLTCAAGKPLGELRGVHNHALAPR